MESTRQKVVRRPSVTVRVGRTASAPINQSRFCRCLQTVSENQILTLWTFRSKNAAQYKTRGFQRRESFLYRQQLSYPPSFENEDTIPLDDEIVTPFAQILATLKDVRANLSLLILGGSCGEIGRSSHLHKAESMLMCDCVTLLDKSCIILLMFCCTF